MKKYEVIESNAGNLYLAAFDATGAVDYIAECTTDEVADAVEQLKQGADPVADGWEFGGLEEALENRTPEELYRELSETGDVVADSDGTYPDRMGVNAAIAFAPKEYAVIVNNGTEDWQDASTNADWFPTWGDALDAAEKAFDDEAVDEVMVAVFTGGEIDDGPLYLRREDGSIHQYCNGERLWA